MSGAVTKIGNELLQVRSEVFRRSGREHTFAIYFGRAAEMRLKTDPDVLQLLRFPSDLKRKPLEHETFMGAIIHFDYGLPEEAVCIHVDGKPYTTFSLVPA